MSYIYLASPYSAGGADAFVRELRYLKTLEHLSGLLRRNIYVYSPIVHCHELAKIADLPRDALFWQEYNFAMLDYADVLYVLKLDGWEESIGVRDEIDHAKLLRIPVEYYCQGKYPA